MSFSERPPLKPRPGGRFGEDLEGLLRAFFAAEMPRPWPAGEPFPPSPRPARRQSLARSRLALAASVGLLLTGSLGLSGLFPGQDPPPPAGVSEPVIGTRERPREKPVPPESFLDSSKGGSGRPLPAGRRP